MKISYGITVHNEAEELNKLLEILKKNIGNEDEIVICVDGENAKEMMRSRRMRKVEIE